MSVRDDRVLAAASVSSLRRSTLMAYRALAAGDAHPLVDLLSPDVEWTQRTVLGRTLVVNGCENVAALLQRSAGDAGVAEFRGIAFRGPQLVLDFERPWWDEPPRRLWRQLGASLSEGFSQTVTFGTAVERFDCSVTLPGSGPGWLDQAFAFETRPDR